MLINDPVDARLHLFEEQHALLQYRLENWCVWALFRMEVYQRWLGATFTPTRKLSLAHQLSLALRGWPRLIWPRQARLLAKTYASALVGEDGNKYKDIYFDDLFGAQLFRISTTNNPLFSHRTTRACFPSDLTSEPLSLLAFIRRQLHSLPQAAELAKHLAEIFQATPGLETLTLPYVLKRIATFHWLKHGYAHVLRRVQPKAVFVADPMEYPLVAAAKEQGLPTIEFQHGFVDRFHPAYSWSATALKHKDHLPVPERLLLFGDHWKEELQTNGFWGAELRVVGNAHLDAFRQRRAPESFGLITSQGLATHDLVCFIQKVFECAGPEWQGHIYIKLHPVHETDKTPYQLAFANEPRVTVLSGAESPSTLELLRRASFHASISSTCHYDALALGVPTAVLALDTHELVAPLYLYHHAALARTPEDLWRLISRQEPWPHPENPDYYFAPGARQRLSAELKEWL